MCSSVFAGWLDDISFQDFLPRHENEKHLCCPATSIAFSCVIFHRAPCEGDIIVALIYWQIVLYFIYAFKCFAGNLCQTVKFATSPQKSLCNLSARCVIYMNLNYESVLRYEERCSALMPPCSGSKMAFTKNPYFSQLLLPCDRSCG